MGEATGAMITIFLPCRDQKREFLEEALRSVSAQTSDRWTLSLVVHRETPAAVAEAARREINPRQLEVLYNAGDNLASGINTAMRHCRTEFCCLLFSDDRLSPEAVAVLDERLRKSPSVDFFHSSRRWIDKDGRVCSPLLRAVERFDASYFVEHGSPAKHLLTWRVAKGLEIGGVDETLARHGGDDFDFPWCMYEAGCRFEAIPECLYEHRVHREFFRLTTDVPLDEQVATLMRMFRKHRVPEPLIEAYLERAKQGYLVEDIQASVARFLDLEQAR